MALSPPSPKGYKYNGGAKWWCPWCAFFATGAIMLVTFPGAPDPAAGETLIGSGILSFYYRAN